MLATINQLLNQSIKPVMN